MLAMRSRPRVCARLQSAPRRWMSETSSSPSGPTGATASAAPESNLSRYAGIAFFTAIAAGTTALGVWQTQRYYWKVNLIEERKTQLRQHIVDLPSNTTAFHELDVPEFCQLRVEGRYKPGTTFYLYPRSAPADPSDHVATPKSGGYIYSLLERENGTPVIVNRGWLPRKLLNVHIASSAKEDEGAVSLVGVLREGEMRNKFTPDNDVENRQFFYLNPDELADAMGVDQSIMPVIIDAVADEDDDSEASLDHFLRKKLSSYLEFYMTPEKHAGYAATWYSFSVACALMAFFRFRKGSSVRARGQAPRKRN